MQKISEQLELYIVNRLKSHPHWRGLKVYYSGHEVAGEGEHKLQAYIRCMRAEECFVPNQRFCMNGQDADMIMLSLATHEPFFHIVREKTVIDHNKHNSKRKAKAKAKAKAAAETIGLYQPPFHYVKINVLRKLIVEELREGCEGLSLNAERLIDDFVFLTFFVGNDFIPHPPTLRIGDAAFDVIFEAYKTLMVAKPGRYLVREGEVEDWEKLEELFQIIGAQETGIFEANSLLVQSLRENFDAYRVAVVDSIDMQLYGEDEIALHGALESIDISKPMDYRRRYYFEKFGFLIDTTQGKEELQNLVKTYVEGVVWCLGYYASGCISWQWFYPHNFAPLMQDLRDLSFLKSMITFSVGKPFLPFQQLLGCLPPHSSDLLPKCYSELMVHASSPLKKYYPQSFEVDMYGERQSYLGVAILPFIDAQALIECEESYKCKEKLSEEERNRNTFGHTVLYSIDDVTGELIRCAILNDTSPGNPFNSELVPGTLSTIPGFTDSVAGAVGRCSKDEKAPACTHFLQGKCRRGLFCR